MTLLFIAALAVTPLNWLEEAAAAEKIQAAQRTPYVYRERQSNWMLDGKAQKKKEAPSFTRVYEHIFLEGAPYRQLIERNGKPISGADLVKRDAARQKEAASRRQDRKLRKPFLHGTRNVRLGKLDELAPAYDWKLAGEETIAGSPCTVLEAEPNGVADTARHKELQSYRQRLWIHRDLKILVQRRIEVVGPDSEILPGSVLTFRWSLLPDGGGTWFETEHEINFASKIFGVKKLLGMQRHEFYEYRRFQVESTITAEPR